MLNYRADVAQSAKVDRVFHALADSTRRALLEQLGRSPATMSQLAVPLGITLSAVVQQVKILEESGLVRSEKVGRVRTCRIEPRTMEVAERWIAERKGLWERRLDRLGVLLMAEEGEGGLP